ncbi:ShlB/FhaC/HecB family hemolysin secretion/activation protein [Cellvibrio polysaccharolyticus]|uniref:ShlB/FhaC/HecB family hemolysin secretion/activation protein n=1 Tax=Cellvibrio polysaccharolyticus TaxID=2082724 RepID=A0A928V3L0_9GAMM|nr:ShlB/FhaC/HecB family hemolysin secretion/activation protein [Cellvibrio polysaccharolyticus]MBE8718148.1 ShlB/FhaC/HecB family hemolysin secretion/activation protein [Cellvibrio polysaccharolyticus]
MLNNKNVLFGLFLNRYTLVSALVLQGAMAHAQVVVPDSGSILRDIQSTPAFEAGAENQSEVTLPADKAPAVNADDGGLAILVERFAVTGNSAFSSDVLVGLVADLQGKTLTLAQLEEAASRITLHYREQGYFLSRAYLPQQDVSGGVITIAVLEGRLGEVRLENTSRVKDSVIQRPFKKVEAGQLVTAEPLETPLLHLSDITGARSSTTLAPGSQAGTTDLIIKSEPAPLVSGTVELDNFGNRYTGEYRLGASVRVNNPTGYGDRLDLRALASDEEQIFFRAQYAIPVGPWATEIGGAWSDMDYELGDQFADIGATGNAQIATAFVRQNFVRTRAFNLEAQLQYDRKDLEDKIKTFGSLSDKDSELYTLTVSGDLRDNLWGGGITRASLAYTHGELQINSFLDKVIDSITARTDGSFYRWTPSIMRLQNLGGKWSLHAQVHGQFASKNLDSSEKLSLGGAYAVRGFPQGEASGDQGWIANLELRYDINRAWQVFGLLDHGDLKRNKNRWSNAENTIDLSAAGLGARWRHDSFYVSGTIATPVDSRDSAIDNRDPRAWVQAIWQF